jgi:hypothetical protein
VSQLKIETSDGRTCFAPGEIIEVVAEWELDTPAEAIELRLLWNTRHNGDDEDDAVHVEDSSIVEQERVVSPDSSGTRHWTVRLPNGPYSFSGALFSLGWALELVVEPGHDKCRFDITVAPHAKEIVLIAEADTNEND